MLNLVRISDQSVIASYSDDPTFVDLPGIGRVEGLGSLIAGWIDQTKTYGLVEVMPAPPSPPTPQQLCDQVDAFRDSRLAAGFSDATTAKTFACDPFSIGKWDAIGSSAGLAILMQGASAPSFQLIPTDNSIVTLSAVDTFSLLNGRVMPWVSATFLYGRQMKNNILAGNPPADIKQGWP